MSRSSRMGIKFWLTDWASSSSIGAVILAGGLRWRCSRELTGGIPLQPAVQDKPQKVPFTDRSYVPPIAMQDGYLRISLVPHPLQRLPDCDVVRNIGYILFGL